MQRIAIAALSALISMATVAGTLESELQKNGLVAQAVPKSGITGKTLDLGAYQVTAEGGGLLISHDEQSLERPLTELQVGGVKIRGTDQGEWGGELTVTSQDGTTRTLLKENVVSIQKVGDSIFVFTGLSHMGINVGAMYELTDIASEPKLTKVTLLPSAPEKILFEQGVAYILTSDSLIAVNPSPEQASMEIIAYKAPWSRFAPNSLVKQGDTFVVAMHAGVTVVKASRFGVQDVRFYGPQGAEELLKPERISHRLR